MGYWCDEWNDNWISVYWSDDHGCYMMEYDTDQVRGRCVFSKDLFNALVREYNMKEVK